MKIGCDIVKIERIMKCGEDFFEKYYAEEELEYAAKKAKPYETLAGMFAAKEAFAKATGKGLGRGFSLSDVVVLHDELGAPYYSLHGAALKEIKCIEKAHLSISHTSTDAMAFCVISYED